MKIFTRLICKLKGHEWKNDNKVWPVRGYYDTPYPDSYCGRCGRKAS